MALRGAVVSHDKWHLCILNVFGALAMLTPPPEGALSTAGSGPGATDLTSPLWADMKEEAQRLIHIKKVCRIKTPNDFSFNADGLVA